MDVVVGRFLFVDLDWLCVLCAICYLLLLSTVCVACFFARCGVDQTTYFTTLPTNFTESQQKNQHQQPTTPNLTQQKPHRNMMNSMLARTGIRVAGRSLQRSQR
jgi:hypothetical protein